jgi:two-component system chemotaxis response regulator CheB
MVASQEDGGVVLKTHQGPQENFCRPSVDVLFHSISRVYGARALAVVLTGMGPDGLKGCETLRSLGAHIYLQDEASSVVWGMPGFVAKGGSADKIPLDQMGVEIVRATVLQSAARHQS